LAAVLVIKRRSGWKNWEKLMPGGLCEFLYKFDAMQMCFASGSAEKKAVFEQLVDEKI